MSKNIQIPTHALVTQEIVDKLDHLFFISHPTTLKNHLVSILMKYLEYEHRSTWFKLSEYQEDSDFYEYCIPTKQYKTIISVVWEE